MKEVARIRPLSKKAEAVFGMLKTKGQKALDTNVLVRFLVNDDEKQARITFRLFQQAEATKEKLYVSNLVILELRWVLGFSYEISRTDTLRALDQLLVALLNH